MGQVRPQTAIPSRAGTRSRVAGALIVAALLLALVPAAPASAVDTLTIRPITWNVVGLDSNKVTSGPDTGPAPGRPHDDPSLTAPRLPARATWREMASAMATTLSPVVPRTKEGRVEIETRTLTDEEIETVLPGAQAGSGPKAETRDLADPGTEDTDGVDTKDTQDAKDADETDTQDADGTDTTDSTDSTDTDGTDGDASDS